VKVNHEVVSIDRENKLVRIKNLIGNDEFDIPYDQLILSPGAKPVIPPIPGVERCHTLRTVEDVDRLFTAISTHPKHATVIGAGFIGIETAENLIERGIAVSLIEASPQVLAPLDIEMAIPVHEELVKHNIDVRVNTTVSGFKGNIVEFSDGTSLESDLVILAIGVRPETDLAKSCGLEIGERFGIQTNDFHQTSDPSIYAIGDAAEKHDALDGSATLIPLANLANRHGRVVADHIAGKKLRQTASIGTAILKVFDLTVAATGWNERKLISTGRAFKAIHTHPGSHAGYYPGAEQMRIKLLMDPESGQILGAQAVGAEGVDKRIDVIATAIRGGITAPELADLELAYAPPFGSAKDPVNMLGYIAENILSGMSPTVQWSDVESLISEGAQIVDVRTNSEYEAGHLPTAINIPVDELRDNLNKITAKKVIVNCQVGQRGHIASVLLRENGIDSYNLDGGYRTWSSSPAQL
jgi:NADPH-dependent 2,4-dienoyl-CoA reductase/sulfur reductase-like enzyme/rhodanese-related sulfurtransferase